MARRSTSGAAKALSVTAFASAMLLFPVAGSCGQISFRTLLSSSMTVRGTGASLSVARPTNSDGAPSANAVTINSQGSSPYVLFVDQSTTASVARDDASGKSRTAGYQLCADPTCATVWVPNGGPDTGILVTPGGAASALPLSVVRAANAAGDESSSDVVLLTMYF